MIRCPKCHGSNIRVHGTHFEGYWGQKYWLFGPSVAKLRATGLDCSCVACHRTFISTPDGSRDTPDQTAYDQLRAAQGAIADQGKGRNSSEKAAEPRASRTPSPAPDPRVRRRNPE